MQQSKVQVPIVTEDRLARKRDQDRERSAKARAEETPKQREERLAIKRREQNRERRARAQEDSHMMARQSETELFEQYSTLLDVKCQCFTPN